MRRAVPSSRPRGGVGGTGPNECSGVSEHDRSIGSIENRSIGPIGFAQFQQNYVVMSMYSELLSGLCADIDPLPLPPSREELVVILLQCRRRLNGHGMGAAAHVMAEDLALELDHDRMLLRLCTAMGIETEPSRFANPLAERERLEDLLRGAGVDFRTLDDHRRVKVA